MEANNYNGVHILSEAVVMGGIAMYFYNKISELESTIEDLKNQITMQNNQIRYLLSSHLPQNRPHSTPLKISQQPLPNPLRTDGTSAKGLRPDGVNQSKFENNMASFIQERSTLQNGLQPSKKEIQCDGGVCKLVPRNHEKKVAISKISKQIEFDRDHNELDQTSKVSTFTKFSPNPVVQSVTPKPSISESGDEVPSLEQILNEIDNE